MKLYITETQYIEVIIDPLFFEKYGDGQWGLYEYIDEGEHFATIYLPSGISDADLVGTIAHEASRVADDYFQTMRATMVGKIVTDFWSNNKSKQELT